MFYTFLGVSNGQYQYNVTLKFFMRCNSGRQFYNPAIVSVFNKKTSAHVLDVNVALGDQKTLSLTNSNPCITNPPAVCYEVGYYYFSISLPASADGYKLASQVTYRISGINNLTDGYSQVGATYTAEIPGTADVANAASNNSAIFTGNDLVIICADNSFSYSFGAIDKDGDKLRYLFCDAYIHSGGGAGGISNAPGSPPYQSVPYGSAFSGSVPLGNAVSINQNTGLITGTAPAPGAYVVTVCVEELRNGIVIATQRKDLQINIAPCTIAAAQLLPEYMLCKNTKTISLTNLSTSPLIKTYYWTLFDQTGSTLSVSSNPTISYTVADTGVYSIKLVVNSGQACSDSTTSNIKVYPGFVPSFSFHGTCLKKATFFADASTSVYGTVNSWAWDFGEYSTSADISNLSDPNFNYPVMGIKPVQMIAGNSVGCRDTLIRYITIIDKPPINLAFNDTLICLNDAVQLKAAANGLFSWSPGSNIINPATNAPTVSPTATTTYYIDIDDNGCQNRDSVKVRVTDHVNVMAMNDTTICAGDTIQLNIVSDGFQYSWTPASQTIDPQSPNPKVITNITTPYQVTARIGGCSATTSVVVRAIPYPLANAGADTIICYQTTAPLRASITGSSFIWSPSNTLLNSGQLNPIARPVVSTLYNLVVYDDKGCPKPGNDQVLVTILPPINAFAGNDTTIIIGQPLQLTATGGVSYLWSPSTGLSNATIANPIASFFSLWIAYVTWYRLLTRLVAGILLLLEYKYLKACLLYLYPMHLLRMEIEKTIF